ncbi:Protein tpx2 [Coemansia sp. RSA 355]|nr:Protein tpx2 [Coemansia sp. RSA 355]
MAKSRLSLQRKSGGTRQSLVEAKTPTRNTLPANNRDSDNSDTDDVWNFDAPQFYDFGSSKTPGPTIDKWFDHAHPTPAPKKSRALQYSIDDMLSTDSRDTLLPTRPSLSPSRLIIESDGRLTLDEGHSHDATNSTAECKQKDVQDVEFSDSDEEIEFNNWKSAQVLANIDNNSSDSDANDDLLSSERNIGQTADLLQSARRNTRTSEASTISLASEVSQHDEDWIDEPTIKSSVAQKVATNKGGKALKRLVRPVREAAPSKSLTVPIELGFMRPTKGAARRQMAKQRDKTNKQMIAKAIAKSITRRLSQNGGDLTVPIPFQFHERQKNADGQVANIVDKKAAKLSKEAQDYLVSKLTTKRKLPEEQEQSVDAERNEGGGTPKKSTRKLKPTIPKTPQFAKSKRVRREVPEAKIDEPVSKPVRRPANAAVSLMTRLSPPKPTVTKPFVFRSDAGAERHLLKLREELAKLREEEENMRQFRANPLPAFPTPVKQKRQHVELRSSPFKLSIDSRGDAYQSKLRARLEELEQRQQERKQFKARPIPTSMDHPFVPQASALPLTAIEEILLRTELRSEERRAYDEDRTERERIREGVLARKRLEEERREEEEIKRLRKILVHKAQPVRQYKPLIIKPSDRALTVPKTPLWQVRTRKRSESPATPTH